MNVSDNIPQMPFMSDGKRALRRLSREAKVDAMPRSFAATFYRGVLGEAEDLDKEMGGLGARLNDAERDREQAEAREREGYDQSDETPRLQTSSTTTRMPSTSTRARTIAHVLRKI